ncbi:unnamed protein product [Peniophora sp. CBMAI 1063]|nr:unnamed protein product [Peniophora sp. CBMAI 1063]
MSSQYGTDFPAFVVLKMAFCHSGSLELCHLRVCARLRLECPRLVGFSPGMPAVDIESYNPAWAPDEPFSVLQTERGLYNGELVAWGAWGVLLAVCIQCIAVLWRNIQRGNRRHRYLLVYIIVMTALATAGVAMTAKWQQIYLIDQRNYPGGPMAYYAKFAVNSLSVAGRFCAFIMNWMADGLLIWRLYVIYQGALLFVTLPTLTFLASFAMSIVELDAVTRPNSSVFASSSVNLGLIYWSLSIAVNVLVTALIVARVYFAQRALDHAFGVSSRRSDRLYSNVSAILIESAALYTIPAIIFLVGYSLQSTLQFTAGPLECIQGIAPLLIILRVANGTAYTSATISETSRSSVPGILFGRPSRSQSEHESQLQSFASPAVCVPFAQKDETKRSPSRSEGELTVYPTSVETR